MKGIEWLQRGKTFSMNIKEKTFSTNKDKTKKKKKDSHERNLGLPQTNLCIYHLSYT